MPECCWQLQLYSIYGTVQNILTGDTTEYPFKNNPSWGACVLLMFKTSSAIWIKGMVNKKDDSARCL